MLSIRHCRSLINQIKYWALCLPHKGYYSFSKMSDESDIEMHSALPKKKVKNPPKSPTKDVLPKPSQDVKKPSTKEMINQALTEMRSRKGISLYAIKKYIEEKFHVDVEKFNYLIKKSLKDGVEEGFIVQTKGMGASGSFRLAAKAKLDKKNKLQTKKKSKTPKPATKKSEKVSKQKPTTSKTEPKEKKSDKNVEKSKVKTVTKKSDKTQAEKKNKPKNVTKIAKGLQTPSKKKAAMMKRKSIGSIIKPPKMKPKSRT